MPLLSPVDAVVVVKLIDLPLILFFFLDGHFPTHNFCVDHQSYFVSFNMVQIKLSTISIFVGVAIARIIALPYPTKSSKPHPIKGEAANWPAI